MKIKRNIYLFLIMTLFLFNISCNAKTEKEAEYTNNIDKISEQTSDEENPVIFSSGLAETEGDYNEEALDTYVSEEAYTNSLILEIEKGRNLSLLYEGIIKKEGGTERGTVNKIAIYDKDTLIQEIIVKEIEGIGKDMLMFGNIKEDAVVVEDINFDGCEDFYVLASQDSYLNGDYYLFIWDKIKENYIYIGNLADPEINIEKKIISSDWRGRNECGRSYYKIIDGELTQLGYIVHEWFTDEEIKVKEYQILEGQERLVKEETKPADRYGEFDN